MKKIVLVMLAFLFVSVSAEDCTKLEGMKGQIECLYTQQMENMKFIKSLIKSNNQLVERSDEFKKKNKVLEEENKFSQKKIKTLEDKNYHQLLCKSFQKISSNVSIGKAMVSVSVPQGYTLTGGGCSNSNPSYRKIVENYPLNQNSWHCATQDHQVASAGNVTVHAIGCKIIKKIK